MPAGDEGDGRRPAPRGARETRAQSSGIAPGSSFVVKVSREGSSSSRGAVPGQSWHPVAGAPAARGLEPEGGPACEGPGTPSGRPRRRSLPASVGPLPPADDLAQASMLRAGYGQPGPSGVLLRGRGRSVTQDPGGEPPGDPRPGPGAPPSALAVRCAGAVGAAAVAVRRWLARLMDGVLGTRDDLVVKGLAAGMRVEGNRFRVAIVYAGVVVSFAASYAGTFSWGVTSREDGMPERLAAWAEGLVWLKFGLGAVVLAVALATLLGNLVGPTRALVARWTPVAGAFCHLAIVAWTVLNFAFHWDPGYHTTWVYVMGTATILSCTYAFLLAAFPSTRRWRGKVLVGDTAVMVAMQAYGSHRSRAAGHIGVGQAVLGPLVVGVWHLLYATTLDAMMSARDVGDAEDEQSGPSRGPAAAPPEPTDSALGRLGAAVWGFPRAVWNMARHIAASALPEDETSGLRVVYMAWWLLMGSTVVLATMALVLARARSGALSPVEVMLPLVSVLTAFVSIGLAVRFARLLVRNREDVLAKIVPKDVANALVATNVSTMEKARARRRSLGGAPMRYRDASHLNQGSAISGGDVSRDPRMSSFIAGNPASGVRLSRPPRPLDGRSGAQPASRFSPLPAPATSADITASGHRSRPAPSPVSAVAKLAVPVDLPRGKAEGAGEKQPEKYPSRKLVRDGQGNLDTADSMPDGEPVVAVVMPWAEHPSEGAGDVTASDLPPSGAGTVVDAFAEELTYYKDYKDITMLFSDLVTYTEFAKRVSPRTALLALHNIFSLLDKVMAYLDAYKYETVGDAYIGAFNMIKRDGEHPLTALTFGCTLIRVVSSTYVKIPGAQEPHQLAARVGLECGDASGGVLGTQRTVLQLVGDTLNTASRMESHGVKNHVQCTENVYRRLPPHVQGLFAPRDVHVKGKGPMTTYVLDVLHCPQVGEYGLDLMASPESWAAVMGLERKWS